MKRGGLYLWFGLTCQVCTVSVGVCWRISSDQKLFVSRDNSRFFVKRTESGHTSYVRLLSVCLKLFIFTLSSKIFIFQRVKPSKHKPLRRKKGMDRKIVPYKNKNKSLKHKIWICSKDQKKNVQRRCFCLVVPFFVLCRPHTHLLPKTPAFILCFIFSVVSWRCPYQLYLSICSSPSQHSVTHNPLHYSTYNMRTLAGTMRWTNMQCKYPCSSTVQIIFQLNLRLPQTYPPWGAFANGGLIWQSVHRPGQKQHMHHLHPCWDKSLSFSLTHPPTHTHTPLCREHQSISPFSAHADYY